MNLLQKNGSTDDAAYRTVVQNYEQTLYSLGRDKEAADLRARLSGHLAAKDAKP